VAGQDLAEFDEGADDNDIHLDGARAVERLGEHCHAVLSKGIGARAAAASATV
jgi:hypothetical protein